MGRFRARGRRSREGNGELARDVTNSLRKRRRTLFAVVLVTAVSVTAVAVANARKQNTLTTLLSSPAVVGATPSSAVATTTTSYRGAPTEPPISSPADAPATSVQISDVAWVDDISSSTAGDARDWTARVEVRVVTDGGPSGAAGALVLGTWSGEVLTTQMGTTDASGVAEFVLGGLADTTIIFTVLDVIPQDSAYDPTGNLTTSLLIQGPDL